MREDREREGERARNIAFVYVQQKAKAIGRQGARPVNRHFTVCPLTLKKKREREWGVSSVDIAVRRLLFATEGSRHGCESEG